MSSDTTRIFRSIRRWLLVIVVLLGVGLVVLANTGYVLTGYTDGPIFAAAGITGGVVVLAAGAALLTSVETLSEPTPTED